MPEVMERIRAMVPKPSELRVEKDYKRFSPNEDAFLALVNKNGEVAAKCYLKDNCGRRDIIIFEQGLVSIVNAVNKETGKKPLAAIYPKGIEPDFEHIRRELEESAKRKLKARWPNADDLRTEFDEIRYSLFGEFEEDDFTTFEFANENGRPNGHGIVNRSLMQHLRSIHSVGLILPGKYSIPIEVSGIWMVLEGSMLAGVNDGNKMTLEKYYALIAPARNVLHLEAKDDVFYLHSRC